MSSFYTTVELQDIGFNNFGHNLLISKKATIYGANLMSFGNNVRIDDFSGDYLISPMAPKEF